MPGVEQRRGGDPAGPLDEPDDAGVLGDHPRRVAPGLRHRAADQRQRDPRGRDRAGDLAGGVPPLGLGHDGVELGHVQPVRVEAVAPVRALDAVPAELAAQPAREHRDLVARPGGRIVSPERVGERVRGHRPAAGERQQLEQAACFPVQPGQVGSVDGEFPEHTHGQCTHVADA